MPAHRERERHLRARAVDREILRPLPDELGRGIPQRALRRDEGEGAVGSDLPGEVARRLDQVLVALPRLHERRAQAALQRDVATQQERRRGALRQHRNLQCLRLVQVGKLGRGDHRRLAIQRLGDGGVKAQVRLCLEQSNKGPGLVVSGKHAAVAADHHGRPGIAGEQAGRRERGHGLRRGVVFAADKHFPRWREQVPHVRATVGCHLVGPH
jgi:hypothetical protein